MVTKRSPQVKYLGIILDDKLQWKQHIMKLERDLVKITNSFKIFKNFVPESEKRKLYFADVHSKIKYGIQVCKIAYNETPNITK